MRAFILVALSLSLGWVLAGPSAQAQCNSELYVNRALKEVPKDFTFVKSFRINGKNGTKKSINYTCVFSKGSAYNFRIEGQDGGSENIIAQLFDAKRNKLASNFYQGKYYRSFDYNCKSTGIYYLTFRFAPDAKSYCGGAVLSFKRN